MRFLVTGATGFIGTHLCAALDTAGHDIVALVRSPEKAQKLPRNTEILRGDLSIFADPNFALPEVDVVVHLAGVVAADTLAQYEAINHGAVVDLVACLERQSWRPKRLLFASSLAAAGPSPGRPWTEEDAPAPIEAYGDAKARAERVVAAASFPTTSFRPCIVLGPDDPATLTLYRSAKTRIGLQAGRHPQRLSVVDVRDLVSALLLMAADRRPGHQLYFVSHPREIDTSELWRGLEQAFGHRVFVAKVPKLVLRAAVPVAGLFSKALGKKNQLDLKQYRQMTAPAFVCSSEALRSDLGWKPKHSLEESLGHALAGYRRSGLL